jgi:beta-galactosidase
LKRTRELFDSSWKFHKDDIQGADKAVFNDSTWRVLDLPHDWSIEGPFDENNISRQSLAYLPGGIGWYRKSFKLLKGDKGRNVFIDFDGIFRFSDVWINGHHLGFFPDGYTSFQYEMTPYLVFNKENVISVRVDNSQQPNSRWYTGSGIYRHTWLTKTSPVYIVKDSTYIQTPVVKAEESSLFIQTNIKNDFKTFGGFMLNVEILDANGTKIADKSDARFIDPGKSERFPISIWLNNIVPWDIDNAYMYTARLSVYEGEIIIPEKLLDRIDVPFGIRSIEFTKDDGFFLNSKHVKIQGLALHHDAGLLGAAVPEKVWERRLQKLKGMGCNSIRNAHSAAAPEFLDMCDRMGLMVFDEFHDEWQMSWEKNHSEIHFGISRTQDARYGASQYFDEWGYKNMAATIRRDRNHPSVIIWGIGNEIYEQGQAGGHLIARKLNEICHVEDPTRPTMTANNQIHNETPGYKTTIEFLEATDLIGYNHIASWGTVYRRLYFEDKYAHPDWKVMGSENANLFGYRGDYILEPLASSLSKPYYMSMLDAEQLWKFTKLYDYVMGDYLWAGIDYMGEWAWPGICSPCGMLDTCGFEKDGYYFFASQWRDKPVIKLIPHWNWTGKEGTAIPVICFTNCDEVELFVNGQSFGKQAYNYFRPGVTKNHDWSAKPLRITTNELHLLWMVPYQPGEIRAVGKKNNTIFEDVVRTCGSAANIELSADCVEFRADGKDICHVEVKLLDASGNFALLSNDRVKFSCEGAGEVWCLDSGSPSNHDIGMHADSIQAYNGRCLAYIKACKPGKINLTVSGKGIKPQSISLKASL